MNPPNNIVSLSAAKTQSTLDRKQTDLQESLSEFEHDWGASPMSDAWRATLEDIRTSLVPDHQDTYFNLFFQINRVRATPTTPSNAAAATWEGNMLQIATAYELADIQVRQDGRVVVENKGNAEITPYCSITEQLLSPSQYLGEVSQYEVTQSSVYEILTTYLTHLSEEEDVQNLAVPAEMFILMGFWHALTQQTQAQLRIGNVVVDAAGVLQWKMFAAQRVYTIQLDYMQLNTEYEAYVQRVTEAQKQPRRLSP